MGRTVPTFTMVLQQEMESWSRFRRGLRLQDQQALDELFRAARLQLAGSAYAVRPVPFESIVMSMLVMQHRRHGTIALTRLWNDDFGGSAWFTRSIEFRRDAAGRVTGFSAFIEERSRDIRFERVAP